MPANGMLFSFALQALPFCRLKGECEESETLICLFGDVCCDEGNDCSEIEPFPAGCTTHRFLVGPSD
jgi:hypothetical protein